MTGRPGLQLNLNAKLFNSVDTQYDAPVSNEWEEIAKKSGNMFGGNATKVYVQTYF